MTYTLWLIIINLALFFLQVIAAATGIDIIQTPSGNPLNPVCQPTNTGCDAVADILSLNIKTLITRGYFWQVFTYMFTHADFNHIFVNMFGLMMFGPKIELSMGKNKFLKYYLICGLFSSILYMLITGLSTGISNIPMMGASGAIMGILTAYGLMYPKDMIIFLFFPYPLPAIVFVFFYGFVQLALGIVYLGAQGGVAYFGHLGGMIAGFILIKYFGYGRRRIRYFWQ